MYDMDDKQNLHNRDTNIQTEEKQLSNINLFFAAYGNFLASTFFICRYFLKEKNLFGYIALGVSIVILIMIYVVSYSKACLKNKKIWTYISLCADRVSPFNPVLLLIGICFAINANVVTTVLWIMIDILQLISYVEEFRKSFPNFGVLFVRRIWSCIKNNMALIVTFLLAILFGWLWFIAPEGNRYAELWLNLSAGFIASFITITVIDRILKNQKETNERPLRQAMYRDIQLFTSRFVLLWQEMYLHSVTERANMKVEELFEPSTIEIIRNSLDLSCMANTYPKQNWFSYIENARKDLENKGQKILSKYTNIAEPEALQAIHYLITDSAYLARLSIIEQMRMINEREHLLSITLLGNYTMNPKDIDLLMVSQLFEWCRSQYEKLHETSKDTTDLIMPIPYQLNFESSQTKADSTITEEKLCTMRDESQQ